MKINRRVVKLSAEAVECCKILWELITLEPDFSMICLNLNVNLPKKVNSVEECSNEVFIVASHFPGNKLFRSIYRPHQEVSIRFVAFEYCIGMVILSTVLNVVKWIKLTKWQIPFKLVAKQDHETVKGRQTNRDILD